MEFPEFSLQLFLIILALVFIAQGFFYAWQMTKTPTKIGWTFLGVITGSLKVGVATSYTLYVILDYFDLIRYLWPITFAPFVILILIGGSMAIFQYFKEREGNDINGTNFDQRR